MHQAIAGELEQPLPGLAVARLGPLQLPLEDRGRFIAHLSRSLRAGRRALRFSVYPSRAASNKNSDLALSLGAVAAGVRGRAGKWQQAETASGGMHGLWLCVAGGVVLGTKI